MIIQANPFTGSQLRLQSKDTAPSASSVKSPTQYPDPGTSPLAMNEMSPLAQATPCPVAIITWLRVAPGDAICANALNAITTTESNASAV